MMSQIIIIVIIVLLALWGVSILLSKNFWKTVGGHVKDGIAKKISKIIIWLIIFSIIALVASMAQNR
ncbi:MAG: hypothetical protein NT165_03650 [Candidatus Falkowbacteria bacterium]|nr:hypothetical protein [Candidatus Falkowbacteria bacterium]